MCSCMTVECRDRKAEILHSISILPEAGYVHIRIVLCYLGTNPRSNKFAAVRRIITFAERSVRFFLRLLMPSDIMELSFHSGVLT